MAKRLNESLTHFFTSPPLFVFLAYLPLLFMGYGADNDVYRVLDTWRNFLQTQDYVPSRLQGYVIYEFLTYLIDKLGGSVLTNSVSLLSAFCVVVLVWKILEHFSLPPIGVLLVMLNPVFIVCATSTVDFCIPLACFVFGFFLFLKQKYPYAIIAFGFASAIRFAYVPLTAAMIAIVGYQAFKSDYKWHSIVITTIGMIVVNLAAYFLPFDFARRDLSLFLTQIPPDEAVWSMPMRIGRWGYKNLQFWGIPTVFLLGLTGFILLIRRGDWKIYQSQPFFLMCLTTLAITEILFFRYPVELEYLLPMLPIIALLFTQIAAQRKRLIIWISLLSLLNGFIAIALAEPNIANRASSATFGIKGEQGYLLKDTLTRIQLYECSTKACFDDVMADFSQ